MNQDKDELLDDLFKSRAKLSNALSKKYLDKKRKDRLQDAWKIIYDVIVEVDKEDDE